MSNAFKLPESNETLRFIVSDSTEWSNVTTKLLSLCNTGTEVAHVDAHGLLHITEPAVASLMQVFRERERYRAALEHIAKRAATDCCANGRGCCICDCDDIAKEALKGEP